MWARTVGKLHPGSQARLVIWFCRIVLAHSHTISVWCVTALGQLGRVEPRSVVAMASVQVQRMEYLVCDTLQPEHLPPVSGSVLYCFYGICTLYSRRRERTSEVLGRTGCTWAFHPTQALAWIVRVSARVQVVWLLDQMAMAAMAVCPASRNDSKPFLSPEGQPVGTEEGSDICLFFFFFFSRAGPW